MSERDYIRGSRAAWTRVLQEALLNLGYESRLGKRWRWVLEREAAIQALREVCARHGDNCWDESLHLADVIDKHLGRNLDALDDE